MFYVLRVVVKAAVTFPARYRFSLGDVMYIAAGLRRDAGAGSVFSCSLFSGGI